MPPITVTAPAAATLGSADTATEGDVSQAQIEQQPRYRVGEILESMPGLIITQHSGEGKANQYFLRGFDLDHGTDIAISLDDMPVNMRTHAHGQGYSDLNFVIPELIGDLHYSKGPYFAALGDFDTAGAVQISYVDVLPRDLLSISGGTLGDYRGLAAMSRPWGAGNILVATEYSHADGPWKIPDNFNKGNVVLRYSQGSADNGFSFTGAYSADTFHATKQIAQRAVDTGLISRFEAIDPTDGGDSARYSLSAKYVSTTDYGQLKANVYGIGYRLNLFNDFDYFVTFPPPIGDQFHQSDRRKIYGGNVSYAMPATPFGLEMTNTVGFQTRTDDIRLALAETTDQLTRFTVRDDHVIEASVGIYVENRTRWLDWVRTVTGLREDIFYGSDTSSLVANTGSLVRQITSPKGNLTMGPWLATEFYASVGQGFHSNDFRGTVERVDALATELNQQAGDNTVVAAMRGPLLTKATGYEAGARSEIIPGLKTTAAVFVLDLDSEATFNGDEAGTATGRPSRRVGVEFSADYRVVDWLALNGNLAFTRARYTDEDDGSGDTEPGHPGKLIPGAAKIIASGSARVVNLDPWSAELRFRFFGRRPLIEDDSVTSRPTALFDAEVGYRLTDWAQLRLDAFNLLNAHAHQIDYFYPSQLANETAPIYDIHFKPVEPLSFRLSLNFTF
ncbi:MAG: TonB-dependent receptor plug domain-containing protein [Alphaproteobacteria bacterium]|nr:TonB-dependent receptor plug domain-containing protein [Alphaproteobacteria bacterium]